MILLILARILVMLRVVDNQLISWFKISAINFSEKYGHLTSTFESYLFSLRWYSNYTCVWSFKEIRRSSVLTGASRLLSRQLATTVNNDHYAFYIIKQYVVFNICIYCNAATPLKANCCLKKLVFGSHYYLLSAINTPTY